MTRKCSSWETAVKIWNYRIPTDWITDLPKAISISHPYVSLETRYLRKGMIDGHQKSSETRPSHLPTSKLKLEISSFMNIYIWWVTMVFFWLFKGIYIVNCLCIWLYAPSLCGCKGMYSKYVWSQDHCSKRWVCPCKFMSPIHVSIIISFYTKQIQYQALDCKTPIES